MPGLCRIDEQGEEPDYQTEDETSSEGDIIDTRKLRPVVEQHRISTQDLRQQPVPQVVEELGEDDAERRGEH